MNLKKFYNNKKVIITGGTGLIGRSVTKKICDLGAKVSIVSLDKIIVDKRAKHIKGDLTNFQFCKKITKNKDFAFHLSGIKGSIKVTIERPASFFVPLMMMNTNFLEACRLNKIKKLVYTSSIGAYSSNKIFKEENFEFGSDPMDTFPGWAKKMAELQVLAYKKQYKIKNFHVVRPANVYGPGDNFDPKNAMVIPTLMYKILKGNNPLIIWGDGSAIRDFAFSEDVADGIIQTLYYGTGNEDFLNLGSGKGVSIRKLVQTLNQVIDFNYKFDNTKNSGFPKRIMDISKAKKIIKYNPKTDLHTGLKKTWEWFIKNNKEFQKRHNYFKK